MSNSQAAFPSIWDQVDVRPVFKPFMSAVWRGIMKMAEAQCEVHSRRGLNPYV